MQLYLFLVPKNPQFEPNPESVKKAKDIIYNDFFPETESSNVEAFEYERGIGNFYNLKAITCPRCHTKLNVWDDDLDTWMYNFSGIIYSSPDPKSEVVVMPCCSNKVQIDKFDLKKAIRFSKLIISVEDPIDAEEFSHEQIKKLEDILGCELEHFTSFDT